MSYRCRCLDLGLVCTWQGTGEKKPEVVRQVVDHLANAHGIAHASSTLTDYLGGFVHAVDRSNDVAAALGRGGALDDVRNWFTALRREIRVPGRADR